MAKRKVSKDYFGLDKLISIILAIIPVTAFFCGVFTRLSEKKYVAAILRLFLGWNIIWIVDIILMATKQRILRLINC